METKPGIDSSRYRTQRDPGPHPWRGDDL